LRHVPEEEDQMRRQDALVHTLPELQDGMYLHTGREEKAATKGVCTPSPLSAWMLTMHSAKYIEGLENRLARMESLMRLSGVLPEDDDGSTDLATLERRLEARAGRSATPRASIGERRESMAPPTGQSTANGTPAQPALPSPRSGTTSPEPEEQTENPKDKEEDALAEMMCSLVTNNCGETRYIGMLSKLCHFHTLTI
jgi:hypothetical protein